MADEVDASVEGSIDNDVKFLGTDSEPITEPVEESDDSSTTEGESEEPEQEDQSEDGEDEQVEEEPPGDVDPNTLPGRPSFKELKAAYPDLLKKFPGLRDSLINESKYAQVFPTIEEARMSADIVQVSRMLESQFAEGKSEDLMRGLKAENQLEKFADGFLPTLQKTDNQAYLRVVTPLFTMVIDQFKELYQTTKDKNYLGTAQRLAFHLFGKTEVPADILERLSTKKDTKSDPEKEQLKQQLQARYQADFNNFQTNVFNSIETELRRLAGIGLDSEKKLSSYHRSALLDKMLEETGSKLNSSEMHNKEMNSLWQQVKRTGMTQEIRDRILKTYLGRAKPILNAIKARENGTKKPIPQQTVPVNRSIQTKPGVRLNPKTVDYSKTTDEDIMHDRITYRK